MDASEMGIIETRLQEQVRHPEGTGVAKLRMHAESNKRIYVGKVGITLLVKYPTVWPAMEGGSQCE